ncbi:hypothetical protein RHSIM_Rhsim02G0006200 [Rhododendron simsii]|uniref:ATPase AAA-type core domain-containing protein n=1 Tax=Rhododendron simsii TaxID=118357 RepID=A0A834LZR0_RHOSS|nr:hypothetical protein RHSIM_Rhsim02G0006200 [Rhododendron simsii]
MGEAIRFKSCYGEGCEVKLSSMADLKGKVRRNGEVDYSSHSTSSSSSSGSGSEALAASEKLVKVGLEENLVPVLQLMCGKGEIKDNYIIYIDTLVGTQELSYRLVKLEDFFEDEALKQLQKKSAELRILCRKQKARINRIYWLKRKLYALNPTTSVDTGTDFEFVDGTIRELVDIIKLMINETDANLVGDKEKVVQRGMKEEVDLSLGDGGSKRAKKGVESRKAQLHNGLWGQATNIVAKAAKKIMDAPHYPASLPVAAFLFLGLTTSSKEKFIGDLAENFVADDGAKLLFTIDLSEYTDSNSLSRLTDALSGSLTVEKAHMSVFTALLSVLDRSMFIDHRGRTVGFRDTIVIISSDAGNKGIFSRLVGHASQNILDSDTKQCPFDVAFPCFIGEGKRCKEETNAGLLTNLGEMVFIDPFASHDDQLRKFATLSMLSGPHWKGRSPSGFSRTFFSLFKPANDLVGIPYDGDSVEDPPEEYKSEDIVIRDLSKKLSVYDGSSCILMQ